ncbi:MAG: hypothetical protein ACI924_002012, partial [Flavobacterium sp.]
CNKNKKLLALQGAFCFYYKILTLLSGLKYIQSLIAIFNDLYKVLMFL